MPVGTPRERRDLSPLALFPMAGQFLGHSSQRCLHHTPWGYLLGSLWVLLEPSSFRGGGEAPGASTQSSGDVMGTRGCCVWAFLPPTFFLLHIPSPLKGALHSQWLTPCRALGKDLRASRLNPLL